MILATPFPARIRHPMATTRSALTDADIHTLIKGANIEERALAAHKLCRNIDRPDLSDEDRIQAHEILRVMANDAAELVRRALAVTLKQSAVVPRDVANKLARDVESIALPLLNFSPAFNDEDLAEIVRLGGPVRQVAIAKRPELSETVTGALVEHGGEKAVQTACANDNAHFSDRMLQRAIDRFENSEAVLDAMAYRRTLPMAVSERLIEMVSDQVRDHLINTQALSPQVALEIAMGSKERATLDLVDQAGKAGDVKGFAAHLHERGSLTASLLLRGLAHGHMAFFEHGVAELAGVPHHRTWLMIHDAGPLGFRAIYDRAGLPARLFTAFRAGVDTYHSMEFDGGARDQERFQQRMLQRFLTQPRGPAKDDVDYLMEKMDQIGQAAKQPARKISQVS
jgi:uncharacterized protein (DUF2336 family)